MILCVCTMKVDSRVVRYRCWHLPPPIWKLGGGWRRAERVKNSRVSYVIINDGS